jgi:hypothetical protein
MRLAMRVFRRLLPLIIVALAVCLSGVAAGETDKSATERVLGPQWEQLSRRAGIVFVGTVLNSGRQTEKTDRTVPAVELSFRVDRPIAGVDPNATLTIHEWTGLWNQLRPLHRGERVLLFLYPPSELGLTSPVAGAQGQIRLSADGKFTRAESVPIEQLERAIRAARQE